MHYILGSPPPNLMRGNLALFAIILALGTLVLVGLARQSNRDRARSGSWLPLAALILGPVVALLIWAIHLVFVRYVIFADAWALLPPVLLIGIFVGCVTSLVIAIALRKMVKAPDDQGASDKQNPVKT